MASGIFAVLDDIAALMDDVAVASKVAAQKTAGIIGDDLAVNAEKATGFMASREIPVLWAITKGSLLNKVIIVPIVLLLSAFFPPAIKFILVLGGGYLAYEGIEKVIHYFFHKKEESSHVQVEELSKEGPEAEKSKIKAAIATDFILSIEIVIIALATVLDKELSVQILSVSVVALIATVGVYGFVALIVRMDDAGYRLMKSSDGKGFLFQVGNNLVRALPIIIKMLSVVGTIALLLVAGGIFLHNVDFAHYILESKYPILQEFGIGILAGLVIFGVVTLAKKLFAK